MPKTYSIVVVAFAFFLVAVGASRASADEQVAAADFNKQVAPILTKYCAGCHNADDAEGGFAVDSFARITRGGKHGAAIVAGQAKTSRLVRMIRGEAKPVMPPEDNEAPTKDEIELLARWIDEGAKGPNGEPQPLMLHVPKIEVSGPVQHAINALAVAKNGTHIAYASHGHITLKSLSGAKTIELPHQGNVNSVAFSHDGRFVAGASGEPGLVGQAKIWDVATGKLVREIQGHRDSIYSAVVSPDGKQLATAGYDRLIKLWSIDSGDEVLTMKGHNGAVFDLSFRNDGKVLASASADRTVKLWDVATGKRLDTLNQSVKELYTVTFSPDGKRVAAGGVDNRIRVWRVTPNAEEGTNRLLYSVFAHDAAILRLTYSHDSRTLISSGEDSAVKVWDARTMTLRRKLELQPDWTPALGVATNSHELHVGRLDGSTKKYELDMTAGGKSIVASPLEERPMDSDVEATPLDKLPRVAEVEPNDDVEHAMVVSLPTIVTGVVHREETSTDSDLFRFSAKQGEQWILETKAARDKSPLDSTIAIFDAEGQPVPRLILRAVRDSEITFRGINSEQLNCRLVNWEEMELNEYLYMSGEVTKLFRKPRGPDSGFDFYPGVGKRYTYFDTSARSHALAEPSYIVVPYAVGTELPDNGLPTFPIFYENDDDAERKLGDDSRMTFTVPSDGDYIVRVADIRGLSGEDFKYELTIRRPAPDFQVTVAGANPTVDAGSGKEFTLKVERIDNFNGAIEVHVEGLPAGFNVTSPIVIEEGHVQAKATINAHPFAPPTHKENWAKTKLTASAMVGGAIVKHDAGSLGTVKLGSNAKLVPYLLPPKNDGLPTYARPTKPQWETLTPAIYKATDGTTLTLQKGGSILASGANPDSETYSVVAHTDETPIRAIRLDVLGHKSLPSGAPGRAGTNGNFVLSDIRVTAISLTDPTKTKQLKFESAQADYAQSGHDPKNVIDDNPKTGWAIATSEKEKWAVKKSGDDVSHWIECTLSEPVSFAGGTMLVVQLDQRSGNKQHNIGHFKLSAQVDRLDVDALEFTPTLEVVIAPGTMTTAQLIVQRNGFDGLIKFDVNNLPHGVIVENIGLNGVLIPAKETERTIYLRAEAWTPPSSRRFHAVAKAAGTQVSLPITIHVQDQTVASKSASAKK